MSQNTQSIIEAMCSYSSRKPVRMHMPGHKGRRAFPVDYAPHSLSPKRAARLLDELRAIDMTESPGLDNLHYPSGCIRATEGKAEKLFGSSRTFFLVNGATSGIQGSLISVKMTLGGGSLVLPRNVHKSLVSAMAMSGLEPIFVWPDYEPKLGGYLPLNWSNIESTLNGLDKNSPSAPKAVFVINPTYSGFARNLTEIATQVHARGMALVVDEAHGTHFSTGKALPPTAIAAGADLVTHGAHKTTVAYTQTAFLHLGQSTPSRFPGLEMAVEEALRAVQTTSPSYILMASMEQAVDVLERDGSAWVDHGTKVALELAQRLSKVPGISVAGFDEPLPSGLYHDPSKLLVNIDGLSVGGPEAVRYLVQKCKVVPEMTGPHYILMLVSGAHGPKDIDAVEKAFRELAERFPGRAQDQLDGGEQVAATSSMVTEVPRPVRVMPLRDAFLSIARPLPIEEALGKVSADTVVIYPPGSPIITPGERIDQDVVEYILHARRAGLNLLGRGVHGTEGELKVFCVECS